MKKQLGRTEETKDKSITFQYKGDCEAFRRAKQLLAYRSRDPSREILGKVLVEHQARGVTITATNGRALRRDKFNIKIDPGVYSVAENSRYKIRLLKAKEGTKKYPSYREVIPAVNKLNSYSINDLGKESVVWAAAMLGKFIDPTLVHIDRFESLTLYVQKKDPLPQLVIRNNKTLIIVMPDSAVPTWVDSVEAINRSRHVSSLMEHEEVA